MGKFPSFESSAQLCVERTYLHTLSVHNAIINCRQQTNAGSVLYIVKCIFMLLSTIFTFYCLPFRFRFTWVFIFHFHFYMSTCLNRTEKTTKACIHGCIRPEWNAFVVRKKKELTHYTGGMGVCNNNETKIVKNKQKLHRCYVAKNAFGIRCMCARLLCSEAFLLADVIYLRFAHM